VADYVASAKQLGASKADLTLLEQFRNRVETFQRSRAELQTIGAQIARTNDMTAWKEYGELVARADSIETKVTAALRAIDSAIAQGRAALGLEGMRALAGLGIVWLIPAAVILAALGVLGYWLADYAKFRARYSEQQRVAGELVAQGVDPIEAQRQASAVVTAAAPSTLAGNVGSALKYALIIGVAFYAWQLASR
jgi:hypothetical protein